MREVYVLAKRHTLYRLSCFSFGLYGILGLTLKRDDLVDKFGVQALYFAGCGIIQSILSFLGDCVYLGTTAFFWPDIVFAVPMMVWSCFLHSPCAGWWAALCLSSASFSAGLYLNHRLDSKRWVWGHILWHCLPLEFYLFCTEATPLDRILLFGCCWAACALQIGDAHDFAQSHCPHDVHALVCVLSAILSVFFNVQVDALCFSFAYFGVDLVTCATTRDWMFVFHASIALTLIVSCLQYDDEVRRLGCQVLLVEASTPLMHAWQRHPTRRRYVYFLLSFFLVRCCFLPYHTVRIFYTVLNRQSLVLLPLNLLQFAWFAKLASQATDYNSQKALSLASPPKPSTTPNDSDAGKRR